MPELFPFDTLVKTSFLPVPLNPFPLDSMFRKLSVSLLFKVTCFIPIPLEYCFRHPFSEDMFPNTDALLRKLFDPFKELVSVVLIVLSVLFVLFELLLAFVLHVALVPFVLFVTFVLFLLIVDNVFIGKRLNIFWYIGVLLRDAGCTSVLLVTVLLREIEVVVVQSVLAPLRMKPVLVTVLPAPGVPSRVHNSCSLFTVLLCTSTVQCSGLFTEPVCTFEPLLAGQVINCLSVPCTGTAVPCTGTAAPCTGTAAPCTGTTIVPTTGTPGHCTVLEPEEAVQMIGHCTVLEELLNL